MVVDTHDMLLSTSVSGYVEIFRIVVLFRQLSVVDSHVVSVDRLMFLKWTDTFLSLAINSKCILVATVMTLWSCTDALLEFVFRTSTCDLRTPDQLVM